MFGAKINVAVKCFENDGEESIAYESQDNLENDLCGIRARD